MPSENGFNRDDTPPNRKRVISIKRVAATQQWKVTVLDEKFQGFWVHVIGGRTVPCMNGPELCEWHLKKVPLKWLGYLTVIDETTNEIVFVEFTDYSAQNLLKASKEYANFRGLQLHLCRERQTLRAPVRATILGTAPIHRVLPPAKDVTPSLRRVWGLDKND